MSLHTHREEGKLHIHTNHTTCEGTHVFKPKKHVRRMHVRVYSRIHKRLKRLVEYIGICDHMFVCVCVDVCVWGVYGDLYVTAARK